MIGAVQESDVALTGCADVFISHVEEDAETALEIARGLEGVGYSAWIYERDSYPGLDYLDQVDRAIEKCQAVLVVISTDTLGSHQVGDEVNWAREHGRRFVPVLKGISWSEFQNRRPKWRMALGIATAIRIPPEGIGLILPRVIRGLEELGVKSSRTRRTEQPPAPVPQPEQERSTPKDPSSVSAPPLMEPVREVEAPAASPMGAPTDREMTPPRLSPASRDIRPPEVSADPFPTPETRTSSEPALAELAHDTSDAFLSYSREDSEFAQRLVKDLKAFGASLWLDLDIIPAHRWDDAIEKAIHNCSRMLVVLSPAAVASPNVMNEVGWALDKKKTVIPVLHRECEIPFLLHNVHRVDFRGDYKTAVRRLLQTLGIEDPETKAERERQERKAEQERQEREAAEAALKAEQERQKREAAEAARKAEKERRKREAAKAARKAEQKRQELEAEEFRKAEKDRREREAAEAARKAKQELQEREAAEAARKVKELWEREAEEFRKAEQERQEREAEAARKAEKERREREAAETARKAERQRREGEAAEAARKAEKERREREAAEAAEAARRAEQERQKREAAEVAQKKARRKYWIAGSITGVTIALIALALGIWYAGHPPSNSYRLDWEVPRPVEPIVKTTPGDVRKDGDGLKTQMVHGLEYVWIPPPGQFSMGCSQGDNKCFGYEKSHEVTLTKGFWMGQTEVTQEAYLKVIKQNPSHFRGDSLPVEMVTWAEAANYCTAVGMRLPTEAEWEYAARGGNPSSSYGPLEEIAWYVKNSDHKTHEVRGKKPNKYGLYDMLGNVYEWTADLLGDYPLDPTSDPSGPPPGKEFSSHVIRGGSWLNDLEHVRSSDRGWQAKPDFSSENIGFRCAGALQD